MTTTAPRRVLGPFAAASVVVGMVVGAGIFRSASLVAANLQNDMLVLTAWALGGLFALGIFNPRANGRGALLGALLGFLAVAGVYFSKAPVFGPLYALLGFVTCFVTGSLLSELFPRDVAKRA